jgi:hypothetical protein
MPVDSIYSPVLKVTYKVEATRVEQRTDFDKLVIDVETKPSIRPRDAIASAGKTLVELFGLARELNVEAEGIEIGPAPVDEQCCRASPFRSRTSTCRSAPTTASSARASTPWVSSSACRRGAHEHPQLRCRSRSTRSRTSWSSSVCRSRTARPGFDGAHFYGGYDDENV